MALGEHVWTWLPHQKLRCVELSEEAGGAVAQHYFWHGLPLAAALAIPAFLDGHFDRHLGAVDACAGCCFGAFIVGDSLFAELAGGESGAVPGIAHH